MGAETAQVHLPVEIWGRRVQEEAEPEGIRFRFPAPPRSRGEVPRSLASVQTETRGACVCVWGGVLSVCPVSQASSQVRPLIQVGQG